MNVAPEARPHREASSREAVDSWRRALAASALLAGCAVGPNYNRPPVPAPPAYKTEGPWRVAAPKDSIPKGAWWEIFNDAELNAYEQQLLKANQSLEAAKDRLNQARSLARVTSAGYFPTFNADPNASRNRYSGNRPLVVTHRQTAHPEHLRDSVPAELRA